MQSHRPPVEIEPTATADAAVIWMHGLGASGHDFEPIVPELGLPKAAPAIRFIFPHAPMRPVTVNGGMVMPAWYDITDLDIPRREDVEGLDQSQTQVEALIAREIERGISAERIVLAGFSQGGAVALDTALRSTQRLAGVLALSTYLPLRDQNTQADTPLPIMVMHGEHDPVIPVHYGQRSAERLGELGHTVEWQVYPMAHEVCWPQIRAIGAWLLKTLAG